jgi:aerobic carbon-monoxide dehydrogenase medium subunit
MRLDRPSSIAQALASLSEPGARCLAGGQSLVAMMNAHLIDVPVLVSLRGIDELNTVVTLRNGTVRVGAMTPYRAVANVPITSGSTELIVRAIPLIAHPAIRNQGTVGGSICHADPAGDFPTLVTCACATVRIAHVAGVREVPAHEFFHGYFETSVRTGELVISIDFPYLPTGVSAHYEKFMLTEGDFAVASAAALIGWNGEVCSFARLAIGACAPAPVRLAPAEELLVGSALDDDTLSEASELLLDACDPVDDFRGSRDYRMKLIPRLLRRAVLTAKTKSERHNENPVEL